MQTKNAVTLRVKVGLRAVAIGALALAATTCLPVGNSEALAATRLEQAIAVAAGRAAGTAADRAVSHAVMNGAARFRGPACLAGARKLRLRGIRHAIFMAECRRVL